MTNITIERNADVLINACKDIGLAVNIGKTKYKEVVRFPGIIVYSNLYEKAKTFKFSYLCSYCKKQEIHAIIQSKHSCRLDFFLRIWKLKYIKQ